MRKRLFIIGLIMTLSLSACTTTSAQMKSEVKIQETEVRNNETSTVAETVSVMEDAEAENLSLSDYMRTVYKTADNEYYDELCYKALAMYEKNDGKKQVKVYESTKDDCTFLREYFNNCFGYTKNIRMTVWKTKSSETYYCGFLEITNGKENVDEYLSVVKKAQEISKTLIADTNDKTIDNTLNWIRKNAVVNTDTNYDQNSDYSINFYYGVYENKPIECVGYALGVYQLCRMNGVSASVLNMIDTTDNLGHAADLVTYSDGKKYVDMAFDEIKNTIPKKYSVYFNSSNQKN